MYYLWGAGSVGRRALEYLAALGILNGIIDSDPAKHGQVLGGLKVCGYDPLSLKDSGVIIAHFAPKETEKLLKRDGIAHWRLSEFIQMWYRTQRGERAIGFLDFPITSRCTLNCRDCMQYIPHRPKQDVPLEVLKRDIDALFRAVSFAGEISIIGGEPFLHKELPVLIRYINENYSKRIGSLVITTNGTITPEAGLLELCRDAGIYISVSDYRVSLPHIVNKIAAFEAAAQEAGVRIERKRWNWTDPGQFSEMTGFEGCEMAHMQLAGGKLWRCTLMAAGWAAGFCQAAKGHDNYDLQGEDGDALHDFLHGSPLPEPTSQCRNCLYPKGMAIPSAVQTAKGGELC